MAIMTKAGLMFPTAKTPYKGGNMKVIYRYSKEKKIRIYFSHETDKEKIVNKLNKLNKTKKIEVLKIL